MARTASASEEDVGAVAAGQPALSSSRSNSHQAMVRHGCVNSEATNATPTVVCFHIIRNLETMHD